MEIIFGIDQLKKPFINPVVTLGNFDGVHLGHQRIFERLREEAERIRGEAVVITFEPHPLKVLFPEHPFPLLTPFKKKMFLIERTGIERVLCIEFSSAFAEISPEKFVRDILIQKVNVKKIVVGYNYRFGKGKSGDIQTLKQICELFHIGLEVVEALTVEDTIVSSSKIRDLIKKGEVEMASKLLGRDHLIIGRVIEGSKRGHGLGFPTANLETADELYPKVGVYAVDVIWKDLSFNGVANVGFNPTFAPTPAAKKNDLTLEVYLLDFDQDIYGEEIQVGFKKRIRDEVRFDSPSHLIDQIRKDIQWAKENVFAT
ncbi:MAG: bifunctional riboflavin kinase/FAD synthetase [Syntrophaceae bacterium]|nr:bifunctional riboflavin kinase/FAD synthetase [Syntrophaceae bacterium]